MRSVAFSDIFEDVSRKYARIPNNRISSNGAFPVIDQGNNTIAGYHDDASLCTDLGPVVVFGDHTRIVKYAEGPFTVGADGTKVLRPKDGVHPKFAFRWLQSQKIISLGYSRHFKLLKELSAVFPTLDEQEHIADILDKADALRIKRLEAITHFDTLSQSIFHEMFGDSQDWPVSKLEWLAMPEKGSIRTGPFGSQLLTSEFTKSGIAVLGIDNTVGNKFSWKERRFISEEKYEQLKRYTVHSGDLIITIMGTLGRCAVVPDDIPCSINTKHLCCITLDQRRAVPAYVHAYFLHHSMAARHLRHTTKGSIMAGLNMGIIKKMPVVVPPVELQQDFANRIAAVESLMSTHRAQLAALDNLFLSLQDLAFRGEL